MKTLKDFLNEATFNLKKDVDFIYKNYFAQDLKRIISGKLTKVPKSEYIDSKYLRSKDARNAHDLNPIKIKTWSPQGNYYAPKEQIVAIGPDVNYLVPLLRTKGDFDALEGKVYGGGKYVRSIINATDIKDGIYHELAHWIDDSVNNFHFSNNPNATIDSNWEINGVIHGMKVYRKKIGTKKWNTLSFDDLMKEIPILDVTISVLKKEKGSSLMKWRKNLFKRMSREKLLGKKMR